MRKTPTLAMVNIEQFPCENINYPRRFRPVFSGAAREVSEVRNVIL